MKKSITESTSTGSQARGATREMDEARVVIGEDGSIVKDNANQEIENVKTPSQAPAEVVTGQDEGQEMEKPLCLDTDGKVRAGYVRPAGSVKPEPGAGAGGVKLRDALDALIKERGHLPYDPDAIVYLRWDRHKSGSTYSESEIRMWNVIIQPLIDKYLDGCFLPFNSHTPDIIRRGELDQLFWKMTTLCYDGYTPIFGEGNDCFVNEIVKRMCAGEIMYYGNRELGPKDIKGIFRTFLDWLFTDGSPAAFARILLQKYDKGELHFAFRAEPIATGPCYFDLGDRCFDPAEVVGMQALNEKETEIYLKNGQTMKVPALIYDLEKAVKK